MDPLDDVALLQIAVLQQDLLERDVEEARRRKRRKSRRYQTRPWLTEERRRLYRHYARLMEKLSLFPRIVNFGKVPVYDLIDRFVIRFLSNLPVFLQLPQDEACHV